MGGLVVASLFLLVCMYMDAFSLSPLPFDDSTTHPPTHPPTYPGMYYLRTKPAANAIQFTVDKPLLKKKRREEGKEGGGGGGEAAAAAVQEEEDDDDDDNGGGCGDDVCLSCQG